MRFKSLILTIALMLAISANASLAQNKIYTIGASAIVDHPSFDAIMNGIKDGLNKEGFVQGKNLNIVYKTAQNRPATAMQIINKYIGDQVDLLVTIGTASSQAAHTYTKKVPIIFNAVTDPVNAGLLKNPQHPEENITGISDLPPVAEHVKLMKELLPNIKKIGFLYNPSEANSLATLKVLEVEAAKNNIKIIPSTAIQTSQVRNAALNLVGKADIFYVAPDNTVVSALETAIRVANENKIPFMSADTASTKRGTLISYGTNYYDMGLQAAKNISQIFHGKTIHDIPVIYGRPTELVLNEKTAKIINYKFPESIVKKATEIIK